MSVAIRHILPYQQSYSVAPVIENTVFDLDMLPEHVESHLLKHPEVVYHSLLGGRGIESVRPETLIQWSVLKQELVIKQYPCESVIGLAQRYFPYSGHRSYGVNCFTTLQQFKFQVIEKWIVRCPQHRILHLNCQSFPAIIFGGTKNFSPTGNG